MKPQKLNHRHAQQHAPLMAGLGLVCVLITACDNNSIERTSAQSAAADRGASVSTADAAPVRTDGSPVLSYADIVSRVTPAVVTIRSSQRARAPRQFPFLNDPLLREFFGDQGDQFEQQSPRGGGGGYVQYGLGSGVIVTPNGDILTNHHVIDGAEKISVELNDNRVLDATVVGSDPPSDLAVLHVDANNLPVLHLGNSDAARVGDVVLAIGNPLAIGQTVTSGIVSAKGRTTGLSDGSFESFIQTDAAINQGNSGGALVNTNGDLIGINSQILSPTGTNIGIGFAIPSNMARNVMDQLIRTGHVRRGRLGIVIAEVTPEAAQEAGLNDTRGVLVNSVQPGSPAASAGIRGGDIILAINGTEVNESNTLRNLIAGAGPGTEVRLTIMRQGRQSEVRPRLAELDADASRR